MACHVKGLTCYFRANRKTNVTSLTNHALMPPVGQYSNQALIICVEMLPSGGRIVNNPNFYLANIFFFIETKQRSSAMTKGTWVVTSCTEHDLSQQRKPGNREISA